MSEINNSIIQQMVMDRIKTQFKNNMILANNFSRKVYEGVSQLINTYDYNHTNVSQSSKFQSKNHFVTDGENLSSIVNDINIKAGKNVMTVGALAFLNGIDVSSSISVGQELVLIADKESVDDCINRLSSWIISINDLKIEIINALNIIDNNLNFSNTEVDEIISSLRKLLDNNISVMLNDADSFKCWLSELSDMLESETNYSERLVNDITINSVNNI